jgi:hypothetical protein
MASGIPEFHPPPWLGGPPRRNPLHTSLELGTDEFPALVLLASPAGLAGPAD